MNKLLSRHAFQNRYWWKAVFLSLVLAFLLTPLLALQATPAWWSWGRHRAFPAQWSLVWCS